MTTFAGAAFGGPSGPPTAAAPAPSAGYVLEVEFVAGTWTDVTPWVEAGSGVTIRVGRSSAFDDPAPGTMAFVLDNSDGRFTPDNPLSPYHPAPGEDLRVRMRYTRGVTTWTRHLGRVTSWQPTFPSSGPPTVTVTSGDLLAQCAGRTMQSALTQHVEGSAIRVGGSTTWELLPLDDASTGTPTTLRNISGGPSATVVPHLTGVGSITSTTADGTLIDGAVEFTGDDSGARLGPYIQLQPRTTSRLQTGLLFRSNTVVTVADGYDVLAQGYNAYGLLLFSLVLRNDGTGTNLQMLSGDGTTVSGYLLKSAADGAWHSVVLFSNAAQTNVAIFADGVYVWTWPTTLPDVAYIVYGAAGNPMIPRKGSRSCRAAIGGIWWSGQNTIGGADNVARGGTLSWRTRVSELWYTSAGLIPTFAITGADARLIARTNGAGQTALAVLAETMRTVGGAMWADYVSGGLRYLAPDAARPTTASLTVELGADDEAGSGMPWSRAVDRRPTRVTATCPSGSATVVDAESEATGLRREETTSTVAASIDAAADVASSVLTRGRKLRAAAVTIDLSTSVNDLWAPCMGLTPGARVSMTGISPTMFGRVSSDAYVHGWAETYSAHGRVLFELYTDAADDPPESVFETGRWSSGRSVLLSPLTSASTSALFDTSPDLLTEDPADYPMDLDIDGERVTVTTAPVVASSTTVTVAIVRGVAPTIARAHPAGAPVDVWAAPCWAF